MKQVTEADLSPESLEHSMIDENTRKAWEYYDEHRGKPSQLRKQNPQAVQTTPLPPLTSQST